MEFISLGKRCYFGLVLFSFCFLCCGMVNTIRQGQFVKDSDFLESSGSVFKLGFFTPEGSTSRYVGIWYNLARTQVVWVANREKPVTDSSGVLRLSEQGNVIVINGQNETLWSSNVSSSSADSTLQLLDSGNLVLQGSNGSLLWQSIEHLGNTFLPKTRLSNNPETGEKVYLTSWLTEFDPSHGNFTTTVVPSYIPEVFVWKNGVPYWRSGPWNGQVFIGVPLMSSLYLNGFHLTVDEGTTYMSYEYSFLATFQLNSSGTLVQRNWAENQWWTIWESKMSDCDVYGKCGAFGSCNAAEDPTCTCLRGFVPKNAEEWRMHNWTGGCVRRTQLKCQRLNYGSSVGENVKDDGFLRLQMMKVPDFPEWKFLYEEDCRLLCFRNCSCLAYAYDIGIGCMTWSHELIDLQRFSGRGNGNGTGTGTGTDLYLRVAHSELDKMRDYKATIISVSVLGTVFIVAALYGALRWNIRRRKDFATGRKRVSAEVLLPDIGYPATVHSDHAELHEMPLFSFKLLATATGDFDAANKLGQGGFGPVYKGTLAGGKQIAVKRLSASSGQGLAEFMNEVTVISKLQHRNLVRLLGCCVERGEKMLVYEYMPNKSLDAYIFDPLKQEKLEWKKRCEIIEGIGRGLLYLHRDSRMRIIHRDLKPSNILLDEELNPKISDFGLARIFHSNQDQSRTIRIVGTYGYMSPEYAMDGKFSEKSDVFSFGVLLLEIVSGRRNTSFYQDDQSLTLLGFAWNMWNEERIESLIDPALSNANVRLEILRCIHIGLLCVQEHAGDRPCMSTVLSMLNSEILDLPHPKQPAFVIASSATSGAAARVLNVFSINTVTVTGVEGR